MKELTYEQFVIYLRSALHYLYDPVHLRGSPLVELLRLTHEFDTAAALQQHLTTAIRQLKPAEDETPQSRAWRIYDILNFQYVRQLGREAVALQLGISERQLRREQRMALEMLAQHLWPARTSAVTQPSWPVAAAPLHQPPDADQALSEELVWLKKNETAQHTPLGEALLTVQQLAQPLAQQWQVTLQVVVPPALAALPVAPLALRSILLTILSVAIPQAGQGPVVMTATRTAVALELTVTSGDHTARQLPFTAKETASLQTAHNLAAFYGAQLLFPQPATAAFVAALTLPIPEQIPVLVIDDNADWLELQQRYAAGSRYQVIGTRDPTTAAALAVQVQPAVILLDVMMHNVDGWQILSELRQEPITAQIPVIICTILPVADLALSLGANAFLQKPVTQHQFLQTLDQLLQSLIDDHTLPM